MKHQEETFSFGEFLIALVPSIGCVGLLVIMVVTGIAGVEEASKKIKQQQAEEAKIVRPTIKGVILEKAVIPSDLSDRAKQEYPYWIRVELPGKEIITLTFDTDDPFWSPERGKVSGIYIKTDASEDFQNKTLILDGLLQVGYILEAKTFTESSVSRQVYSITKVTKP